MTTSAMDQTKTAGVPGTRVGAKLNAGLLLGALGLLALFVILCGAVQYSTPALVGNDGYYHIKMGWFIRQEGLKPAFTWLPLTILNADAFYDHHLLYHVYLAFFAGVDPALEDGMALAQRAKIAAILMPALAFLAIWWLLRRQEVPYASLWALGLFAVSEAFLYRMSMVRAQSASLLVLALALHWLWQGRYSRLLPLGFVYVWFYNAFPLLLVVAAVYVVAVLIVERRLAWQALVYPTLGIGLGIVVNPYFPENVTFIIDHLLPKLGDPATRVGNEWYPYETWTLVENSGAALGAFVLGALALGWRGKRMDTVLLVAFTLAVLFGLMTFRSRRFIEYFPAFSLIFLALSVSPLWSEWEGQWRARRPNMSFLIPLGFLLLLLLPLRTTLLQARDSVGASKPADLYADASLWLKENAPPGTMIFQTDWDDFTRLFFYNDDVTYTAGLDPTYSQLYDAELYELWVDISRGRIDEPGMLIRDRFGASFVFSDLNHERFIEEAEGDPHLDEVYRDEYAVIYGVTD